MNGEEVRGQKSEVRQPARASLIDRRFRLTFGEGDYSKAVADKALADAWIIETGLLAHPDVSGGIYPPDHPESPWYRKFVVDELLPDPRWKTMVDLDCESAEALELFLGLALPGDVVMVETTPAARKTGPEPWEVRRAKL